MRLAAIVLAIGLSAGPAAAGPAPASVDCEGPAGEASPGTPEWFARDANNLFCGQERRLDQAQHPASVTDASINDAYRRPARHDGVRFRFEATTIEGLAAEIYRPCAAGGCTAPVQTFEPPYPAVIMLHGGGSRKELHWWSSQSVAEAGYLVVTFDGANLANARTVLDALFDDPRFADFDGARVGVAGHSIGGDAASILAHTDPRVGALVSWDRAGLSSPSDRTTAPPSLYMMGDYGCPAPLVCPPEPRGGYPDPAARGAKAFDFELTRDAGIDTMVIAIRAALHFDWVPSELSGNRYAELVNVWYMTAWYDRYLRGDASAFDRLTATVFDGSADVHNISQGFYDAASAIAAGDPYAGNVPYAIAGMPIADRLSFYYPSRCDISVPGSAARAVSDDMRTTPCA